MKLFTGLLAAAAILIGTAEARDLTLVEGAYEASLGNVIMPRSIGGTVLFQTCDDCDSKGLRVSGETVFEVSGASLPLEDFLRAVEGIRDRDGGNGTTLVAIYYDLDRSTVTRINVLPARG